MNELRYYVLSFLQKDPNGESSLIVGSDSQYYPGRGVEFVTAIIVYRKGFGGIYFWEKNIQQKQYVLRQRMYEEALMSLHTAETLLAAFENYRISRYNIQIHVDIGPKGKTKDMIQEIVGMIRGNGYEVRIKPESYGASTIADKYT
jgi:hypothetical protein